jgi:hypothetical protein
MSAQTSMVNSNQTAQTNNNIQGEILKGVIDQFRARVDEFAVVQASSQAAQGEASE